MMALSRRVAVKGLATVLIAGLAVVAAASPARATAPYVRKLPPLTTRWTFSVSTTSPLPAYPRPQLERDQWRSLNGRWQYEQAQPGQGPPLRRNLAETILVPFAVQSPLSGIERHDMRGWYRRIFTVPAAWRPRHLILNFGAVSWRASVYVNGRLAGTHVGDYVAFSLDITRFVHWRGPNELVVGFYDPVGGADEPVGKQIPGVANGIYHTASSGIWETVWLESVQARHITDLELTPDLRGQRLFVTAAATGGSGATVIAQALAGTRVVASATGRPGRPFALRIRSPRLWSPGDPYLYGLRVRLLARNATLDRVSSYFGMRSISVGRVGGATRILLNGRFVFQSGALDQGYWPDGLYTAPTDAALRFDILAAKRLGYDMLREHAKVQSDRWYYWADKLGILVWQDVPNLPIAGHPPPTAAGKAEFRRELRVIVIQHRSDPSIVTWVPFNEGWDQFDVTGITRQIKHLDPTRLVDSDSGSANCCNAIEAPNSDIRDTHLYFGPFAVPADRRASVIGEYGGVLAFPPSHDRWPGVLTSIGSPALSWPVSVVTAFLRQQYAELLQEMRIRGLSGAVFTELGSYEQELGVVSYDRRAFTMPPGLVRALNESLIRASGQLSALRPGPPAVPPGTTGLWRFDEGHGTVVGDASGHGHPLFLRGGAGWRRGIHGSALAIDAPGQSAVSNAPVIDTSRSFTVSAWLNTGRAGQSGSAVSEPGSDGSSFSLGIQTAPQGDQSLSGEVGRRKVLSLGQATWWTFAVPASSHCPSSQCGVRANMRYDDGRFDPRVGSWRQVTGVYDRATQTISVYVDGVPEDVEHTFGIPAATGPLTVGAGLDDYRPSDTFFGAIDQLRTYGSALDPAEVWALYRAERR
jgi:Concanavalin A-like lectin/glucanases superfamily/Glycosyl hydrolases family 2/Glycosyl hydrolases family 2, sugar binding domain